ncbi:aldehyde dehydrogenase family protein [bacterium]|nr:aldehyde dehydrogenase family protein [bacterium]
MSIIPLLIGGRQVRTTDVLSVTSPWSGETVGECCRAGEKEVQQALDIGHAASKKMKDLRNYQRADILHRTADLISAQAEDFAHLIALEGGKPILEARGEAARAVSTFRLAAEAARIWGGELLPLDITPGGGDRIAIVKRFPLGLVTGISPFNFPLNLVAHKVAPAIATGNAINIKPASSTPLTALKLGELMLDAGLPPGALNVLPMKSELAVPLLEDPRVKAVTFTGSGAVGRYINRLAFGKRICLELGGNAAALVEPDADLDHALNRILVGGYAHSGQVCISVQHVLLQWDIYDDFMAKYIPMVESLKMGDPLDESTKVTALIDNGEAERIEEWIKEAISMDAILLCGGERNKNCIAPLVLTDVPDDAHLCCDEAFAPLTVVSGYDKFQEAIDRVNSWKYGLQTGVFTTNIEKAMKAYNRLDVGGVIINDVPTFRVDNYPYGGVKESGFGREGVKYAMDELSELKTMVMNSPR